MSLFNRTFLYHHFQRAGQKNGTIWPRYDFLWHHTAEALRDRLRDIKRDFDTVIEIGHTPMVCTPHIQHEKKMQTVHFFAPLVGWRDTENNVTPTLIEMNDLPVITHSAPHSVDLIICMNYWHWVEDLPRLLHLCRTALKPDGLLLFSLFGGDTLHELRDAIQHTELHLYGGCAPRLSPMISLHDMAALLQQSGFALPVVDHDHVTLTYTHLKTLVQDIRGMGQSNAVTKRNRTFLTRDFWQQVEEYYRAHHGLDELRIRATVDCFYGLGWSPSASQPQPLKRGSGVIPLGSILRVKDSE
jgi:SAM-dependent methyltransferase